MRIVVVALSIACVSIAVSAQQPPAAGAAGRGRGAATAPPPITWPSPPLPDGPLNIDTGLVRPVKITSALLGKYGIPANAQPFGGRAELGYVTVRDGKAYIDGQPLTPPETATLAEACKQPR